MCEETELSEIILSLTKRWPFMLPPEWEQYEPVSVSLWRGGKKIVTECRPYRTWG